MKLHAEGNENAVATFVEVIIFENYDERMKRPKF
jgi:hypothetical protein